MERDIGIYYVSKHGQTEKIAHFLGECFGGLGWDVYVTDLRSDSGTPDVSSFSAVLVGAPVYMERYPRVLRRFVAAHRMQLMAAPVTGFFSTCLTATPSTREAHLESLRPAREFLEEVSWTPDWLASFPGALNFRQYGPLQRWILKRISRRAGGPTDASRDYEFTRWDEVARFAKDLHDDRVDSPYRAERIALATRALDELMPEFEQRMVQEIAVHASPDEVRSAIESTELADMPMAQIVQSIRNLGRRWQDPSARFAQAAAGFGAFPIHMKHTHEVAGALIGQFRKRDYGIRRMQNQEDFKAFSDPGYTKALTNFWFDDYRDDRTILRTETRIHSLGTRARRRFHGYWTMASPGVRLYMGSVLRGIARSAVRRRQQHHPLAA